VCVKVCRILTVWGTVSTFVACCCYKHDICISIGFCVTPPLAPPPPGLRPLAIPFPKILDPPLVSGDRKCPYPRKNARMPIRGKLAVPPTTSSRIIFQRQKVWKLSAILRPPSYTCSFPTDFSTKWERQT